MRSLFTLILVSITSLVVQARFGLDGGMSGGGGNVMTPQAPDQYTSPEYVDQFIKRGGIQTLKTYLSDKKERLAQGALPGSEIGTFEKLFQKDIFGSMQEARLMVEEKSTCYDSNGQPVDGNFYLQKRYAICISALNIVRKVHRSEIKPQTLALLMHEYSESLGFTENEAQEIQKIVLDDLKK